MSILKHACALAVFALLAACGDGGTEPEPKPVEGFALKALASASAGTSIQDGNNARFVRVSVAELSGEFIVVECFGNRSVRFVQAGITVGCMESGVHFAIGGLNLSNESVVTTVGGATVPSTPSIAATTVSRIVTGHRSVPTPMVFVSGAGTYSVTHAGDSTAALVLPVGSPLNVGFLSAVQVKRH